MFEEEAEEYVIKKHNIDITKQPVDFALRCEFAEDFTDFQKGVEFGYNEAMNEIGYRMESAYNEGVAFGRDNASKWHYMKDEGMPKKDGFYFVAFHNIGCDAVDVGQCLQSEWWHKDEEIRAFINKNIYAWKALPNPPPYFNKRTN